MPHFIAFSFRAQPVPSYVLYPRHALAAITETLWLSRPGLLTEHGMSVEGCEGAGQHLCWCEAARPTSVRLWESNGSSRGLAVSGERSPVRLMAHGVQCLWLAGFLLLNS